MLAKKRILITADYFFPSQLSGGPIRTLSNFLKKFGKDNDLYLITRDRDPGDKQSYQSIEAEIWNRFEYALIFYHSLSPLKIFKIKDIVQDISPQFIYLNSVFSNFTVFILFLKRFNLLPRSIVYVLAPRGELASAALDRKVLKKKVYLWMALLLNLYDGLRWQATSQQEVIDIKSFCPDASPQLVLNIPFFKENDFWPDKDKHPGKLNLIYLSRITPIKNLHKALEYVGQLKGEIRFDIYGPVRENTYWDMCQRLIEKMPDNIKVNYRGIVEEHKVEEILQNYHFFVLLTKTENFGHAIFESFSAGCPVIISNRTPWKKLEEERVGWDLPLESPEIWVETLQRCVYMDQTEYDTITKNLKQFVERWWSQKNFYEDYNRLFS